MSEKEKESKSNQQSEIKEINHTGIFSKEKVNMGHQCEIDYLKALGVFLMVETHYYDEFSPGYFSEIIYFLSFILGAAGFMLLMGIGMQYSRYHAPKNYIARGIGLLTMGQLLNLLRDCLPNLLAYWATGKNVFISRALQVIEADILPFAGLSFFLLAFMKTLKLSSSTILIISLIMNIAAYPLFNIMESPKNFLLSQFLGFFVLTDAESFFPLCSYFVFVAFGYWLGDLYQHMTNKDKFYNLVLIICLPLVTIYYYFRSHYDIPYLPEYFSDEHYCLCPGPDAIASCMTNLIALALFYKLDEMLGGKTPEFVTHAGKNLNQYYIISCMIIFHSCIYIIATKGEHAPKEVKAPTFFSLMVIVICRITIDMNDKYIGFTITKLKKPKQNIVFALVWILSIISVIYIYPKVEVYSTFWNNYQKPKK